MMKGLMIPPHQLLVEENMSNLTSASGEASVSSNQQSSFASPNPNPNPPPAKKKRNLPGNPDPEAEVISLSPKTLMATNRFICEICNKGFQRDQNLQLHRRGHNLPWKLKQRSSKEVRKKVYICPEITCVHHDPSRALGDLTGIKKHFSRKHGEKKWKCDKCSKKYAVQSDWKAHSKICGTREYRCDCGTLFSRRDSFITHRAFCDALAEESARSITGTGNLLGNPHLLLLPQPPPQMDDVSQYPQLVRAAVDSSAGNGNIIANHALQEFTLKREIQQAPFSARPDLPAWLATQGSTASLNHLDLPSSLYSSRIETEYSQENHPPPPGTMPSDLPEYLIQAPAGPTQPPAHMSATALLQKAAQMGATISRPTSIHTQMVGHGSANGTGSSNSGAAVFGFGLSSHHQENVGHAHGSTGPSPLLHGLMMNGMDRGSLEMLGSRRRESINSISEGHGRGHGRSEEGANAGGISDGLTRDFLGLRAFSHRDLFNMAGLETCMSTTSSSYNEQQNKKPWHGN